MWVQIFLTLDCRLCKMQVQTAMLLCGLARGGPGTSIDDLTPKAAPGLPRSCNFSSLMKNSLGNISENGKKTKPAQLEAAAFTSNNPNNPSQQAPQKEKGHAHIEQIRLGLSGKGYQAAAVTLAWYFKSLTCCDYTEAVCRFQKNLLKYAPRGARSNSFLAPDMLTC